MLSASFKPGGRFACLNATHRHSTALFTALLMCSQPLLLLVHGTWGRHRPVTMQILRHDKACSWVLIYAVPALKPCNASSTKESNSRAQLQQFLTYLRHNGIHKSTSHCALFKPRLECVHFLTSLLLTSSSWLEHPILQATYARFARLPLS